LQYLSLASNQLTGSIPPQLGNLTNLQGLYLSSNQLTGSIPAEIGSLAQLRRLYLDVNQLGGSIPVEIGLLTNVQYIFLNSNQLTGAIPSQLGNLPKLERLALWNNRLSGPLPASLGNLAKLNQLIIHSNQLMGPVPSSLSGLTSLWTGGSDFRWNGLYSSDPALVTFLNRPQAGGDWQSTQTVAVTGLAAEPLTASAAQLTWVPIAYTGDTGAYRVFSAMIPGGPYTLAVSTADKATSSATVTGLAPGTPYYFTVVSITEPHAKNQSTLVSEPSGEVSATTLGHRVKLRRHLARRR
jgi:hypothetical protein